METINLLINDLLGLPFTVGFVFILAGLIQSAFPPKKINSLYGYRTNSSMQSEERWDFAQGYSAKKTMIIGVFLMLASTIKLFFVMSTSTEIIVSTVLIIAAVVTLIAMTEKAIKNKFPQSK